MTAATTTRPTPGTASGKTATAATLDEAIDQAGRDRQ